MIPKGFVASSTNQARFDETVCEKYWYTIDIPYIYYSLSIYMCYTLFFALFETKFKVDMFVGPQIRSYK